MTRKRRDFEFCSIEDCDKIVESIYAAILVFLEVLFSVLITCCSTSMIGILYRQKQQVQHICSMLIPPNLLWVQRNPEHCTSVHLSDVLYSLFYLKCLSCSFWWSQLVAVHITAVISLCFPILGAFILWNPHFNMYRFCFVCAINIKPTDLFLGT